MAEGVRSGRVIVVGAGIGGLCSALVLAHRGLAVTLVEAADTPGGKIRQVQVDGVGVDSGPTVFTMRWVLEQMLAELGTSLEDILTLEPIGVLARHAWAGQAQGLDLLSDTARSADAIAQFSSPAEARRFLGFCQQTRALYDALEKPYIRSERPNLLSMVNDLGLGGMATLSGLGPFATLWRSLGRHFHDPRLQQLFGRYATYCGSSPWSAPATLMLVAQVELDGVWSAYGLGRSPGSRPRGFQWRCSRFESRFTGRIGTRSCTQPTPARAFAVRVHNVHARQGQWLCAGAAQRFF